MVDQNTNPAACVDFKTLTPFQPRQFVPDKADLAKKETVASLYQQLLDRGVPSEPDMERLILNRSELEAAIAQQKSILYIQMTCQTDDPQKAKARTSLKWSPRSFGHCPISWIVK